MSGMFHGLSAFPLTPADAKGRVDADSLTALLERLDKAGVDSIGLLGSTGSYVYLTREERHRAIETTTGFIGARRPVIVGVGTLRTDDAQDLARDAEAAGANGLLLAPVSYQPLTQDEVFQHFKAVAGATMLPLCIYNNPGTTRFTFSDELLKRLADIETVAAVKMPLPADGDFSGEIARLRALTGEKLATGYSGDWGCGAALLAGADAWYSVIGGLLPVQALALTRAAQAGNATETARINSFFEPLWSLFREFGSYRVVYAAANLLALTTAQPPLPVQPLSDAVMARVQAALDILDAEL